MEAAVAALATFAGAVVTGLFVYLGVRRRSSGRVATSDAASLWTESATMRKELRDEVAGLRLDLAASNAKLDTAITRITELLHQVEVSQAATEAARKESEAARKESELSRAETVRLQGSIDAVHQEVRTGNALTLGALADNAESRRVADIPEADRTDAEREHIDTVGITEHPKGGNPG